jgi:hypothetical protein
MKNNIFLELVGENNMDIKLFSSVGDIEIYSYFEYKRELGEWISFVDELFVAVNKDKDMLWSDFCYNDLVKKLFEEEFINEEQYNILLKE